MKKVVLKIPFYDSFKEFLQQLDRLELLQIYRLDEHSLFTLQTFRFKNPNIKPLDFLGKYGVEIIEVISQDRSKNEYTCFAKTLWPEELVSFFQDPEMLLSLPVIIEDQSIIISFIAESDKIDKIFERLSVFGDECKVISVTTALSPNTDALFQLLTEKQRKILLYAIEKGYYSVPRKITIQTLAKKFEISPSALSEHLRKIERTIFESLFKILR